MIPNIDSGLILEPFRDVSGIFVTVNSGGEHLTWVKIPTVDGWNAYCFEQKRLDCFDDCFCVIDPKSVDMKVEF